MILTLESTKNIEGRQVDTYKIGRYTVKKITYPSGLKDINVREDRDEYLPTIYCRDDYEGNARSFEIQTTSYGALSAEETMKVAAGLTEAVEVATVLTREFVKA